MNEYEKKGFEVGYLIGYMGKSIEEVIKYVENDENVYVGVILDMLQDPASKYHEFLEKFNIVIEP